MGEKVNQLILHVKQLIQDGNKQTSKCIRQIENEIDSKQNEIRQLFSQNIDPVIQHYLKYNEVMHYNKKIELQCEDFTKQIEKSQKLNQYDQNQIQKNEKYLDQMKQVRTNLSQYHQYVKNMKVVVENIREDKYNNAIKQINQYRKNQPTEQTPLKDVLPIVEKKVQEYLMKQVESFWNQYKGKMYEIGKACFDKISYLHQQKLNIYNAFFGRSSTKGSSSRTSTFIRPTNSRVSSLRVTKMERQTSSILKQKQEGSQILDKYMVRINVEMSTLKKVKMMAIQMRSLTYFGEILKGSITRMIDQFGAQVDSKCKNVEDLCKLLASLVGFLLIRREVVAFFDLKVEQKMFLGQIYMIIDKEMKNIYSSQKQSSIVTQLKKNVSTFTKILTLLNLNPQDTDKYSQIITDLLNQYKTKTQQFFTIKSHLQISNDNFTLYKTNDQEMVDLLLQVLPGQNVNRYRFTGYVVFFLEFCMSVFQECSFVVEDVDVGRNGIYDVFAMLFEKNIQIYGIQLKQKTQPFEIIQGQINLQLTQSIYRYFLLQLELVHNITTTSTKPFQKSQKLKVELTSILRDIIKQKIDTLMQNYQMMSISNFNQTYHDFVQWILEFVNHVVIFMREMKVQEYEGFLGQVIRIICGLYWEYLRGVKEINLIMLSNLDLDLSFIYKYCSKHFAGNQIVLDKLKSLREFYSLMLTSNINDLLQPQKRMIAYPNLENQLLIPMLKKYVQVKTGGQVRQLRKKDVEAVVKKMGQIYK